MEFVSRDSLVEEITGIKKDDMAWDSAKQTIANIDNALRKISSYNDTIGIPDFNKDSYIKRMSVIYNDFNLRSVIYKLGEEKNYQRKKIYYYLILQKSMQIIRYFIKSIIKEKSLF